MTRAVALLLTVLTGFTGLVYEVTWQKYIATLLGSHSEATATVLGVFLAGLSLGYWLFGLVTRKLVEDGERRGRAPDLLVVYGVVEIGVGVYALSFPVLFELLWLVSHALPHGAGGLGFAFDALLVALLLGPPTILMGGTIPLLTQSLSRGLEDATRLHALVYACNTTGAFAGALAAAFIVIPALGLSGSMRSMGLVNLGAGLVFGAIGLRGRGAAGPALEGARTVGREGLAPYAAVALLSGFALMVVQNAAIRLGGLAQGSSEFTFATIVAVFVLCIALGSFGVALLPRIPRKLVLYNQCALAVVLLALYWPLERIPYWAHLLRVRFGSSDADFLAYNVASFFACLVVLGLPAILSGATLPLLFDHLRRRQGELGSTAGALYSWNTVGSLLGALLGGYILLFRFDLHQVYRFAVAAVLLSAAILALRVLTQPRRMRVIATLIVALIVVGLPQGWRPELLSLGLFRSRNPLPVTLVGAEAAAARVFDDRDRRIVFYDDDPVASIAVVESPEANGTVSRSLLSNGKSDGGTGGDYPTMALAALVPALMTEKLERAFVIGYGTGITVGELAALEGVEEVVVAEISPGVLDAAPLFDFANQGASVSPKTRILRADAYRALMRSQGEYDVIVSEPSNPWVTGVEMLYSREFLTAARSRLSRGGVYVQWYHQYETDARSVALVLRTFSSVFERVAVWFALGPDLLVLGFNDDEITPSVAQLKRGFDRPDIQAGLRRARVGGFAALLSHELIPVGVLRKDDSGGPVHTLYHPLLNHLAGAAFFRGATGRLPMLHSGEAVEGGLRNSLPGRYLASFRGEQREVIWSRMAREACMHRRDLCGALLAQRAAEQPGSPGLAELRERVQAPGVRLGGAIAAPLIEELAGFHDAAGARADPQPLGLQELRIATQRYRRYFQFAAPFDSMTLIALWQRCQAPAGAESGCEQGLRRARSMAPLGDRVRASSLQTPAP